MSTKHPYYELGLTKSKSVRGEGTEDPEDDCRGRVEAFDTLGHDHEFDLAKRLASVRLTTETAACEDPEQDEDDHLMLARRLTLTTMTKANENQESDPEDGNSNEILAARAMTTTLTESSGDHESDPDDDIYVESPRGEGGSVLPLAYRFAESVPFSVPALDYDQQLQVHVLRDGTRIVDFIQEQLPNNDPGALL